MKNAFFLGSLLSLTVLISCSSKEESASTEVTESQTASGNTLTDSQIEKITEFHTAFAEVYDFTLEETLKNFRGEANVDSEIGVWMHMAEAYKNYINSQPDDLDLNTKKEAYKLILLRSMMSDEETLENAKLKVLSKEEAKEVLSHYNQKPDPLDVGV
ncbi:hypothetical protein JMN32_13335 [Fulvivirga sp. 29W222]|uniref:Uncharacterized protein n=1 Tax=Fulvivirga marina TaxID=2494733 RepID=A0A937G2L0_9BACT|nr:hypothetical protein [Fulvivirga marina]MBL6447296.1 hypothetical protein [Fulvivirga marina]